MIDKYIDLNVLAFSTNCKAKNTFYILKDFFASDQCSGIRFLSDDALEFFHSLRSLGIQFKTFLNEISDFSAVCNLKKLVDSVFIFVDLEDQETLNVLDDILNYLRVKVSDEILAEIELHIFCCYSNSDQDYCFSIEDIQDQIEQYWTNCKYNKINISESKQIIQVYEDVITQLIENKAERDGISLANNNMCDSNCIIL